MLHTAKCAVREEIEMIPKSLDEWTVSVITDLLTKGYFESEDFDFKERLPHNNDEPGKARLVKTCCAFANSGGGFLIFGVSDNTSLPIQDRLVGIAPTVDFPEHFGSYPQKCMPNVQWDFKNPPISLESGNVIHVIYIAQSWNAPHSFEVASDGRCFAKRTNKGNEPMSYEEIRMAFLQYYEKRLKLQLLQAELRNIKNHAEKDLLITGYEAKTRYGMGEFGLSVIETVLADTYTILAEHQELLDAITEIRNRCRIVNDLLRIFYRDAPTGWGGGYVKLDTEIEKHNFNVEQECRPIISACDRALGLLENIMRI